MPATAAPFASLATLDEAGHPSVRVMDSSEPEEKRAHWQTSWDPFYPSGANHAVLIEVVPLRIEIISIPDGLDGDPDTWRADVVEFGAGES